jgi:cobalt/nickel transport protein
MTHLLRSMVTLAAFGLLAPPAHGHYNMLLLAPDATKKGEAVTVTYQWGHPFEHELFDAPAPEALTVIAPDGKKTDLTKSLEKITRKAAKDKQVTAYRVRFTPEQRGDYVFVLTTPSIWMEEEQEFYHDTVKAVLHVQAQKGWDAATGQAFEMTPLTRPYGLLSGMVFRAQALFDGKPLAGALVEIERYNATAPKDPPPDEFRTFTAKTDPNGVVAATLTEPGWWCLTTQRDGGTKDRSGKSYPVRRRSTLWVRVDHKAQAAKK